MASSLSRKFLRYLSKELASIASPLVIDGKRAIFGAADHIAMEISNAAETPDAARKRLEWLEQFLQKCRNGARP